MGRRRGGGVKEKDRKKVTVKLIERKHAGQITGPYRIMEKLIADHHPQLKDAKIALAWRYGWKATTDGHTTLGQCKKGSDLDRESTITISSSCSTSSVGIAARLPRSRCTR